LDNGVYLVASPTLNAIPARIITPAGGILAEAAGHSIRLRPIDLNQEWRTRYYRLPQATAKHKASYIKETPAGTYWDLAPVTKPPARNDQHATFNKALVDHAPASRCM